MTVTEGPRPRVRARQPKLDFSQSPKYWVLGDPQSTHTLNILHYGIPAGERFFVDGVRAAMPYITDAQLLADARGFVGQESTHARMHEKAAERLDLFSIPQIRAAVEAADRRREQLNRRVKALPEPLRRQAVLLWLSQVVLAEHVTAVLADIALDDDKTHADAVDPQMAALLRWHAVEELEHRSVPFDVYRHLGGTYAMRVAFALPAFLLMPFVLFGVTSQLMQADPDFGHPFSLRQHLEAARARRVPSILDVAVRLPGYLLPNHHPSKVGDDRRAAAYLASNPPSLADDRAPAKRRRAAASN